MMMKKKKKEMMGGGQSKREESRFSSLGKLFVLKKVKEKKKISPADWVLFQPQVDKHTNQPISSTK